MPIDPYVVGLTTAPKLFEWSDRDPRAASGQCTYGAP